MSDVPRGEGWWRASDDLYYPPEAHPEYRPFPPPIDTGVWARDASRRMGPPQGGTRDGRPIGIGTPGPGRFPGEHGRTTRDPNRPSALRIIVGTFLAAIVCSLGWLVVAGEAGRHGLALGAIFMIPFAMVMLRFVTDGGRWRGIGAALFATLVGAPAFFIAALLAAAVAHDAGPMSDRFMIVMVISPAAAIGILFGAPLSRRRMVVIRPTGPAPFVALVVFGVLFGGLAFWRISTLTPLDDAPARRTTAPVPVVTEPTPTEADKWCLLGRERARAALVETNLVNDRDHDGHPVVTPDDIDREAFGPDGFRWYLDERTRTFYLDEERMPC